VVEGTRYIRLLGIYLLRVPLPVTEIYIRLLDLLLVAIALPLLARKLVRGDARDANNTL
jgi:hypothetical protein